jgi:hypothetical protein
MLTAGRVEVFFKGSSVRRVLFASRITLRFGTANSWDSAIWLFGDTDACLPASEVEQIGALDQMIDVAVVDGAGNSHGPIQAEAVMTGYPHTALCFIFHQTEIGFWKGLTVARSFGQIAVVPYEFDPL